MKVLFIGGTGLISEAVSKLAIARGIELFLFNRGKRDEFVPEGAQVITGDIRDSKGAAEALGNMQFDVVVDWIAFTPEHVSVDIELFRGRTKQYVFISSASAYQKPPQHYIITEESTPLENPYWQYSRDKIACEKLLMEEQASSGYPVTIVRPSYTYGDTMIPASLNSWQHPWSIVARIRAGKPIIVHGDGSSLWTMTHNTDFAKGFVGLLGKEEAIGQAYHITSDEVLTWNQIYEAIGAAAGEAPKLVHIASSFLISHDPDLEGGLLGDKSVTSVFDNSKIKALVPDFDAALSFAEGIKRTVAWFEAHPSRCTEDEAWNLQMDAIIAAHESGFKK
ncbi:nucleoside-diphosphate-sugar epimerase [Paenibacillus endophyticus]|uniref:Nucleoside-diphosphate-sugar epimerase n=1 Tax=Paenibacillus endophyticus TaxID=1294268 RepID=A0A7W5C5H0_9BACL|nr:SDR family oxidoreductase [Paenibacillus endophyticus]MBB3151547.1 nucleoside-diphosphate-sugar epimerase [Paenibacillus endophyticus]